MDDNGYFSMSMSEREEYWSNYAEGLLIELQNITKKTNDYKIVKLPNYKISYDKFSKYREDYTILNNKRLKILAEIQDVMCNLNLLTNDPETRFRKIDIFQVKSQRLLNSSTMLKEQTRIFG